MRAIPAFLLRLFRPHEAASDAARSKGAMAFPCVGSGKPIRSLEESEEAYADGPARVSRSGGPAILLALGESKWNLEGMPLRFCPKQGLCIGMGTIS